MQEGHLPSCWGMLTASDMFCFISCHGVSIKQVGFCNTCFSSSCRHLRRKTTPVAFGPARGDPIGLAGRRLNRSAKVSLAGHTVM